MNLYETNKQKGSISKSTNYRKTNVKLVGNDDYVAAEHGMMCSVRTQDAMMMTIINDDYQRWWLSMMVIIKDNEYQRWWISKDDDPQRWWLSKMMTIKDDDYQRWWVSKMMSIKDDEYQR